MKRRRCSIEALAAVLALTACSRTRIGIEVPDAWARPASAGANSALRIHTLLFQQAGPITIQVPFEDR